MATNHTPETNITNPVGFDVRQLVEGRRRQLRSPDRLLTHEEHAVLIPAAQAGLRAQERLASKPGCDSRNDLEATAKIGRACKDQVVRSNLGLVYKAALRMPRPVGIELDDIVHEGVLGLMHAVKKFEVKEGHIFGYYATAWIKSTISHSRTKWYAVRVPDRIVDEVSRWRDGMGFSDDRVAAAVRFKEPVSICSLAEPENIRDAREDNEHGAIGELAANALFVAVAEIVRSQVGEDGVRILADLMFDRSDLKGKNLCATAGRNPKRSRRLLKKVQCILKSDQVIELLDRPLKAA